MSASTFLSWVFVVTGGTTASEELTESEVCGNLLRWGSCPGLRKPDIETSNLYQKVKRVIMRPYMCL